MQAVERGDEVEARVAGQRLALRVVELDVVGARGAPVRLGARERVVRDLVAMEARLGKRARHLEQRDARAAADVGHARAALERGHHARDARQRHRHEQRAIPGRKAALDARGRARAERVVVEPDAARERLGHPLDDRDRVGQRREHPAAECRMALVGEHGPALGRECEATVPAVLEHARGALLEQPLAQPALGEARAPRELGAVGGAVVRERAVQAEPIAEADHRRGHRARERAEHVLGEFLEALGIGSAVVGGGHRVLAVNRDPMRVVQRGERARGHRLGAARRVDAREVGALDRGEDRRDLRQIFAVLEPEVRRAAARARARQPFGRGQLEQQRGIGRGELGFAAARGSRASRARARLDRRPWRGSSGR